MLCSADLSNETREYALELLRAIEQDQDILRIQVTGDAGELLRNANRNESGRFVPFTVILYSDIIADRAVDLQHPVGRSKKCRLNSLKIIFNQLNH
jgi:hypothetical protein